MNWEDKSVILFDLTNKERLGLRTYNHGSRGSGENNRNGDGGDNVVLALEVCGFFDALKVFLLLDQLLPRPKWGLWF